MRDLAGKVAVITGGGSGIGAALGRHLAGEGMRVALADIEAQACREVARRVGRAAAVRAVGAANGANPIPLVIPCHRVVASDGSLGGYGGGRELKARLLAMERSHSGDERLLL